MHPAMLYWWKTHRRAEHLGAFAGCGGAGSTPYRWQYEASADRHGDFGGSAFGVRRPLRFLAFKLDLDDAQMAELAKILHELKTERAQAEVDQRRTVSAFADAVGAESFDEARAEEGARLRTGGAERLREAVVKALRRIHAVLEPEQRERFAYLIRTGAISL